MYQGLAEWLRGKNVAQACQSDFIPRTHMIGENYHTTCLLHTRCGTCALPLTLMIKFLFKNVRELIYECLKNSWGNEC